MRRGGRAAAFASLLVLGTLLSGCGSDAPERRTDPATPAPKADPDAVEARFLQCDELDLLRRASVVAPSPLKPRKDATGQSDVVPQAMRCAGASIRRADNKTTNLTSPIGIFTLVQVEEIQEALFDDAVAYFYVTGVVAKDRGLAALFQGIHYPSVVDETLQLTFSDLPGAPEARASLRRGVQGASSSVTESAMAGMPTARPHGALGLYSVNQTHVLAHLVEFTAYKSYRGSAVTAPEPGAGPLRETPSVDPALHSLDYDVTFSFNKTVVPIADVTGR